MGQTMSDRKEWLIKNNGVIHLIIRKQDGIYAIPRNANTAKAFHDSEDELLKFGIKYPDNESLMLDFREIA